MFEKFAEVDRNFIKAQVQQGFYTSEIEVVRSAVRKLREDQENRKKLDVLKALVMAGHQQAVNGELIPYSDDFIDKALKAATQNHEAGKRIKDEVQP